MNAPNAPFHIADPAACMCSGCTFVRIEARLRDGAAQALRCDVLRVFAHVWRGGDGRWTAALTGGDLAVSYRASTPGDAAQGVLAALTGALDLGGAS